MHDIHSHKKHTFNSELRCRLHTSSQTDGATLTVILKRNLPTEVHSNNTSQFSQFDCVIFSSFPVYVFLWTINTAYRMVASRKRWLPHRIRVNSINNRLPLSFLVDFPKSSSRLPVRCLTLEIFLIFFHVINLQQMQENMSFSTREKCFFLFQTHESLFSKTSSQLRVSCSTKCETTTKKNRITLVWKGSLNMITFQKWQKKNSPFLTPFLHLHKYKHFNTIQYKPIHTLWKENWYKRTFACFPTDIYSASSLTNPWQKLHSSRLVLLFQIFWRHKRVSNRLDLCVKKDHFKTTTGRIKNTYWVNSSIKSVFSVSLSTEFEDFLHNCHENIWTNSSGFPRREWSFCSNLAENQHLFCVHPTNRNLTGVIWD